MAIARIDEIDITGKKVLIRVDYNVPLNGNYVVDDMRIRASLPTIRYALSKNAAIILCSHLGKPKGEPDPRYSLAPAARRLAGLIEREVRMAPDCIGDETRALAAGLMPGEILMLENLRFHPGEEACDMDFSREIMSMADIYVDDAFGAAHRKHASIVGFPAVAKQACAGMLLMKEWKCLHDTLESPERPFVAIIGGVKVSSKLGVLKNLVSRVDAMCIGGAMANTFLAAQGYRVGKSKVEPELYGAANEIIATAKERGIGLYLPVDCVITKDVDKPVTEMQPLAQVPFGAVPDDAAIMDIGPLSAALFALPVETCKTVLWNGPMGAFENPAFAQGSFTVAQILANNRATSIIGGGDTDAVVQQARVGDQISFISTGGGASLEFLEGKELPAFQALEASKS